MEREKRTEESRRPRRTDRSIALSLSAKLFWEGIAGLLSGILLTLLLFALSLLIYAESSALEWAEAASQLFQSFSHADAPAQQEVPPPKEEASSQPSEETADSQGAEPSQEGKLVLGSVRMERLDSLQLPDTSHTLPLLRSFLPRSSEALPEGCSWQVSFSGRLGDYWLAGEDKSPALRYLLYCESQGEAYAVEVDLSLPVRLFTLFVSIFSLVRLVGLLTDIGKNRRTIGKMLRPIADFAETAHTLNASASMTPEELQTLAGKLDEINAAHLDTRISVGDTQRELKSLAAAINGMLDRLSEAYRSQARFVSDASHELRTPIAVIQGYANLLDRWGKNDPKAMQESIDAIKGEAAAMKELVEQLLFLARGDSATIRLEMEPLDLSALAQEVLSEAQMIDTAHSYTQSLAPQVYVTGDAGLIKQLLRILVDNSVKYTPEGGRIVLSTALRSGQGGQDGGEAVLTVQDEGCGIPAQSLPHIFDRFYRTDQSRTRKTGGAGLGLSIAKWIVGRHGGHFEVLSREQIGTRISVVLPQSPTGPDSTQGQADPAQ